MRGLRKGLEAARLWATREPGWRSADDRARAALRGRHRERRRARRRPDRQALALGRGRLAGGRGRDGLGLRAARRPGAQLAALRGPRRGPARRQVLSCGHGRRHPHRSDRTAPGRRPRAAEAARGLPLTRLRSKPRWSGSRPRCSGPASGTTRRPPPAPRPPTPAPSASWRPSAGSSPTSPTSTSWPRWRPRTRRWRLSWAPSWPRSSAASPSWRRRGCSAASTTPATRSSPSTPGPGAPTPRTGPRSSCACTCAGRNGAASRSR